MQTRPQSAELLPIFSHRSSGLGDHSRWVLIEYGAQTNQSLCRFCPPPSPPPKATRSVVRGPNRVHTKPRWDPLGCWSPVPWQNGPAFTKGSSTTADIAGRFRGSCAAFRFRLAAKGQNCTKKVAQARLRGFKSGIDMNPSLSHRELNCPLETQ